MFVIRENWDGKFQIVMDEVPFGCSDRNCYGSMGVIEARLLGFSYPDYLKYCRANYNGILRGHEGYSYCVFKDKKDCLKLCGLLNKEWDKVKEALGL